MPRDDADCEPIDLVAEEFAERCRRGEHPSVSEFAARHPEYADQLRALLPSVVMIEDLKLQRQRARGGPGPGKRLESLGDFRIIRAVGQGGMGIVYEAEQVSLGRLVALKVLPMHAHLDPNRLRRFQREAQAAGRLHHPHIVPVLGVGEHDGLHYYVMQFIDGRGLDQVLIEWKDGTPTRDEQTARWREVARIGIQAAEALQHAHEQGVLHRDVKPANLLLDTQGAVWVTDFGLAKVIDRADLTHTGDIIGTLQYMAPEQFQGQADVRTDVYSLGLTLYELVTLTAGFQDSNPSRLVQRMTEGEPPRPRKLNPAIPIDLETIVLKAIAREPARRYGSAGALADDLGRFLDDRPVRARRVTVVERLWRWGRRHRAVAVLSATAAASLLAAVVSAGVGYARTATALNRESKLRDAAEKATQRADENVALSLAAIEDLFEKLAGGDQDDRPEFDPERDGPPPDEPFGPPPDRPRRPPGAGDRARGEADMLQSILSFYDKFAARNATNTHLQREAARAYRRIGDLHQLMGRADEATAAHDRGIALFEALAVHAPADSGCRFELAELYVTRATADSRPDSSAAREAQLRKAILLCEQFAAATADDPGALDLSADAYKALGALLEPTGRVAEAEASLRRAIAQYDSLALSDPEPPRRQSDPIDARRALAEFLARRSRRPEARALLLQCVSDLRALARNSPHPLPRPLLRSFDNLPEALRNEGESALADQIERESDDLRPHRRGGPPPRGPGPGRRPPPPRPPRS